ncbi:MAG: phage major capsid protein [Lachnospiraceae bacterium]|nr:phage major capsid protein [Lachnospiraceae bacterium]
MTSIELIDKKEQLQIRAENILSGAEKESRKLTDEESANFNEILNQIEVADTELREITNNLNKESNYKTTMKNFSLLKAVAARANGKQLDEHAQEVVNAGIAEMRKAGISYSGDIVLPMEYRADVQATVEGAGKENVATDVLGILPALRAKSVLVQAGANYMTGLTSNFSIPVYSGANVTWEGEVAEAKDGAGEFTEVKLEPKRLTAYVDVSKQFLIQDSNSAEELLKMDIVNAITEKLEKTILGDAAGTATMPAGMFNGVSADTAAVTYLDVVNMEAELEDANVSGDIKFIVSPTAKAVLKTTQKGENAGFIMQNGEVEGYDVLCSSAVAPKGIVMGNFSDFVIGQWGGIELTVDPYTQAANGKVRLVVNAYFDAKPRRAEAFVKRLLK